MSVYALGAALESVVKRLWRLLRSSEEGMEDWEGMKLPLYRDGVA